MTPSSTPSYIYAVGRRKTAVAQIRLFAGKWESKVNTQSIDTYVKRADLFHTIYSPLKVAGVYDAFHFEVKVEGSGESAQAEAIRHAIARALVLTDENHRIALRGAGYLSRDARQVERKKPGLHKARKGPSWSKR